MADARPFTAVVLRTIRYGESDIVAHLYTLESGRLNVIAKGARKARSRLGGRLEPFSVATVVAAAGRGELAWVRGIESIRVNEEVRSRHELQQLVHRACDLLTRLLPEAAPNPPAFHLTANLLGTLAPGAHPPSVLAAYAMKLLFACGLSPQLTGCVRCGAGSGLVAFSARDGGVVCEACATAADASIAGATVDRAVTLLRQRLADIDHTPAPELSRLDRRVWNEIVAPVCMEHGGFRPRPPE